MQNFFTLSIAAIAAVFVAASSSAALAQDCPLKLYTSLDLASEGSPVFDVSIADQPYRMGLDTAWNTSVMSKPLAEQLHLVLRVLPGWNMRSGNQEITQYATVPTLVVGKIAMDKAEIPVMPEWKSAGVIGWFGANLFDKLDGEIDLSHKKINLFSQDHCPGQVVYWTDSYTSVPYKKGKWGNFVFKAKIDGVEFDGTISTGKGVSTLGTRIAESKLDVKTGGDTPFVTDSGVGYRSQLKKLELGGLAVMNPEVSLVPLPECKGTGNPKGTSDSDGYEKPDCGFTPLDIGVNVLKKLRIYIASKEQKIYISAADATK